MKIISRAQARILRDAAAAEEFGGLGSDWYRVEVPGGDSDNGPDGSMEPTCDVAAQGYTVARCETPEIAALCAAAPDLAFTVIILREEIDRLRDDVDELRQDLATERGREAGGLLGWDWIDGGWRRYLDDGTSLDVERHNLGGWTWWIHGPDGDPDPEMHGECDFARDAMQAADAAVSA